MIKPSFKIKTLEEKKDYGRFVIEPLQQSFGHTLGNALRRCLLITIPGAAVTKVKIEGVRHQFSTLEGMKEDIVELILNIKQIMVIYKDNKEVKLRLRAKGPKEVKAGDITTPAEVEIVNKELQLAKLADKNTKLDVDLWVNSGYGYSLAEERKTSTLGVMPVDATFSPVTRINYKVEATRVGRRTDFDKLILEIWTNGTIKPKDSLVKAAEILVSFFKQIYSPAVDKKEKKENLVVENESLKLTVEELNLPTRVANALRKGGYETVKDLNLATKEEVSKVKNLGAKSVDVVAKKLKQKGVYFKK